jgi:hypothetical protein
MGNASTKIFFLSTYNKNSESLEIVALIGSGEFVTSITIRNVLSGFKKQWEYIIHYIREGAPDKEEFLQGSWFFIGVKHRVITLHDKQSGNTWQLSVDVCGAKLADALSKILGVIDRQNLSLEAELPDDD